MQRYANLSGNSGVVAYELGRDFLRVRFTNGATYRYGPRAGHHVEAMKRLAVSGQGLAGYISRNNPPYDLEERR